MSPLRLYRRKVYVTEMEGDPCAVGYVKLAGSGVESKLMRATHLFHICDEVMEKTVGRGLWLKETNTFVFYLTFALNKKISKKICFI